MKILIIKTSSLGDIIHAFPVLNYLRNRFPSGQIDWVVEEPYSELIRSHPEISNTLGIHTKAWRKGLMRPTAWKQMMQFRKNLRKEKYDCVFDLQSNVKSGLLTLQARSHNKIGFGWPSVHEWPNLLFTNQRFHPPEEQNIRHDLLYIVQSYFDDHLPFHAAGVKLRISDEQERQIQKILTTERVKDRIKIMVCPGSAWKNKQVTEEALLDFLKRLQAHLNCSFLFVWGSQEERLLTQRLAKEFPANAIVVDRLPLSSLQNLMANMNYVIAMDSLPLHLAGTTPSSTFSIFGASLAAKFKPTGDQHHSLQGQCPYGRTFPKRCAILRSCKTGACIRTLQGDALFNSFKSKFL